jgi:hypothetical protein
MNTIRKGASSTMRGRRLPLPEGTLRVYLRDEAPPIGSGWRLVLLESLGPKWARIRDVTSGVGVRLAADVWKTLARGAKEITP